MNVPDTPGTVLAWLHEFAYRVTFQEFAAGVLRQKNRVIVEFRCADGAILAAGARSISTAVAKAANPSNSQIQSAGGACKCECVRFTK